MKEFILLDETDQFIQRDPPMGNYKYSGVSRRYFPSDASCITDRKEILGKCLRACWYRCNNVLVTNPIDARVMMTARLGNLIEDMYIENWKKMGIWVDDHVKFYNPEYRVSGEIDCIVTDPQGDKWVVECKSFAGYYANKQIGGIRGNKGSPKENHLCQTVVYLNELKNQVKGAKIIYIGRDELGNKIEFNIKLRQDGYVDIEKLRPLWGGYSRKITTKSNFTVQSIYDRFKEIDNYVVSKEIPPQEYKLEYPDEEIERMIEDGASSKAIEKDYLTYKRGKKRTKYQRPGDWQCKYCRWMNHCWK